MTAKTEKPSAEVRIRVMKRDRFTCTYCGTTGADAELEIDHIIPISKGGSNHISNLTTACRKCNQKKGNGMGFRVQSIGANQQGNSDIRDEVNSQGLIGLFVHRLDGQGNVRNQGHVIGIDTGLAIVQRFSFFDGTPTDVICVPISELTDEAQYRLYRDNESMVLAYFKEQCRNGNSDGESIDEKMASWKKWSALA